MDTDRAWILDFIFRLKSRMGHIQCVSKCKSYSILLTDSAENAENSLVATMHFGDVQHDFQRFLETQIIEDPVTLRMTLKHENVQSQNGFT